MFSSIPLQHSSKQRDNFDGKLQIPKKAISELNLDCNVQICDLFPVVYLYQLRNLESRYRLFFSMCRASLASIVEKVYPYMLVRLKQIKSIQTYPLVYPNSLLKVQKMFFQGEVERDPTISDKK